MKHRCTIQISRLNLSALRSPDEVPDVVRNMDAFKKEVQSHQDFAIVAVNVYVYVVLPLLFLTMLIFGK